jgi:hypothetical protein
MGMLKRMLIPRSVRRATHPVRTVKRAVTPKPIKQVRRALNPVSNAKYGLERSLNTKSRKKAPSFTHAGCTVHHRTAAAAAKCRTGRNPVPKATKAKPAGRLPATHAASTPSSATGPQPAPARPAAPPVFSEIMGAVGTNRPVTLVCASTDGAITSAVVEILSVEGNVVLARNRSRQCVEEYDMRTIQRVS